MEKGKKYVAMVKDPYLIDKERLRDPTIWFSKAAAYSATVLYLQENIILLKTGSKISHIFKAIETAPYLTGLAAELYMKGYLIFKGLEPDDVREFQHHLSDLRNKCLEYGDLRFKNDALIFFTDTLGEHIMEGGGIRYPDKKVLPIFLTYFEEALGVLMEIRREIEKS